MDNEDSEDLKSLWHQVAGHKGHGDAPGFLMGKNGRIYKNISHDIRGEREENFYKKVFSEDRFLRFRDFVPEFFGTINRYDSRYITLSDACHGFKVPCGSDIKVGTVDYCSLDSPQKVVEHQNKNLGIARDLGFRFAGANVYNVTTKEILKLDKKWGLSFTEANAALKTEEYFHNSVEVRRDVIPSIVSQISALIEYYSSQRDFWLCRSSLLIVYDGMMPNKASVKLIDFAHNVSQDISTDNTHLEFGLRTLLGILSFINQDKTVDWKWNSNLAIDDP